MKIVNSPEESGLLIKGDSEPIKSEVKEQKGGFLGMLLGTLGASLLGSLLMNFNGVYSRNNLSKIKDGACVINLDEYELLGTHWIALYVNDNKVTYFDSFGDEHIP